MDLNERDNITSIESVCLCYSSERGIVRTQARRSLKEDAGRQLVAFTHAILLVLEEFLPRIN